MKKLSLFSSLFILIFFSCQKKIDDPSTTDQDEMIQKAYEACHILSSFKETFVCNVTRSSSGVIYPTYFGGTYLDEDKNPVILTTDMTKQGVIKKLAGSDAVIVKPCVYSYNYLHDIDNKIIDCLRKRPELLERVGINRFGVISDENCIEVTLVSCTPEKINLFKSLIIDEPVIKFNEDPSIMTLSSGSTDSLAKVSSTASSATPVTLLLGRGGPAAKGIGLVISYRARNGSIRGFVTSGHMAELGGGALTDLRYGKPEPVGRIVAVYTSFDVDASFCQIYDDSGIEIQSRFRNGTVIPPMSIEPQKNGPVRIELSSGVITRESVTVSYRVGDKSYMISDCSEATYEANDGNSGYLAYLDYGDHKIYGIHVGYNKSIRRSYFCKVENINAAFGLSMY